MPILTVFNVSEEVHRALRVRAALRGSSMEAEACSILKETLLPEGRTRLGSLLTGIGKRAGLTDEEFAQFAQRDPTEAQPINLQSSR